MCAAQHRAVHGRRRLDSRVVVNGYRLLKMIASLGELAQITLTQPDHPVRLQKHRRVPDLFRKPQTLFAVVEGAFVFGANNIDNREAELRSKELGDVVQLQAKL